MVILNFLHQLVPCRTEIAVAAVCVSQGDTLE